MGFDFEAWQDYLVIDTEEHLEFGWKGETSQKLEREAGGSCWIGLDWVTR